MAIQLSDKQKWLLAGAAAIVIFVVILKSRSSSGSGGSAAAATAIPVGTVAAGATTGAAPISTGQLANFESQLTSSLDSAITALQASGTTTATSTTPAVTTPTGAPASSTPAATPTVTAPSPAPNVTPVGPPPGSVSVGGQTLDYISNPQEGSALAASGQTIDAVIAGSVVPVVVNGQRTAAWNSLPQGTKLYDQPKA